MLEIINEIIATATLAITLLGVALCLVQRKFVRVSSSFAMLLAAISVANSSDAFFRVFEATLGEHAGTADLLLWLSSSLFLAPLFWIYVFALTSPSQRWPRCLRFHFALPLLALATCLFIILAPQDIVAVLRVDGAEPTSPLSTALLVTVGLLQLAVYPQMAVYLIFIIRRMIRYRRVLRDVYASTERHELRWITVIAGLAGLYWTAGTVSLLMSFDPPESGIPSELLAVGGLASLTLVAVLTLWGLRQQPPLALEPNGVRGPLPDDAAARDEPGDKYEKSALSSEASSRLARKLRAAMERDHLHRDPNISLWSLARHIGASPNYISQTLNEVIGESFFEFVNGYRVADAMERLATTQDTVLAVAYDVGFNTRSSFYNAFKRVTGETPTNYRKTLSVPVGTDDCRAAPGKT